MHMDNGPGATMPMGNNGMTQRGDGPNVAGPAMAKPESKGNNARPVGPLMPKSAP
jgi:hypothetical protein